MNSAKRRGPALVILALCLVAHGSQGADEPTAPFPTLSLLPKEETGALRFLERHPESDGRGVTVAIFDTGVDPAAPGLQVTSDGRPKIIDIVDATGSGDVSMAAEREIAGDTLEGLTGRTLTLNPAWKIASGKVRLGIKRGYELFPEELVTRLKQERRREWDRRQETRAANLQRQLHEWDAAHPEPNAQQQRRRQELVARREVLKAAREAHDDPGPIYDCLTFHDGEDWRAVIDTDEDGDLADEQPLTNYFRERQFSKFSQQSQLSFSVNIYEDGKLLSIVTMTGDHGTHVAGIVGACSPDEPARNGVAPGVQIVSVKIGDTRLRGMETGRGLVRGLRTVLDRDCDLINMSYGEPSSLPNSGRLIDLFSELVHEHGVVFVASAGNAGPALSTVGAPGGTSEAVLGIGAYISPAMMSAAYSLRAPYEGLPYTWTSRGPTSDGAAGVNLFAPGGAISPVPNYNLQPSRLMNGTSMAAPNACGNIALLLSALKAEETRYTPASVRRALENTAMPLKGIDSLTQGRGLVQVDRAYDWFQEGEVTAAEQLPYDIEVGADGTRGILLREPQDLWSPLVTRVTVQPRFREQAPKQDLVDFEVALSLESSHPWVHVGDHLLLTAEGNDFEVEVDPRDLEAGVHLAYIDVTEVGPVKRGPLLRIPVTVVKPHATDAGSHEFELALMPGEVARRFVVPPPGASWVDIRLQLTAADAERRFMLHSLQLLPGRTFEAGETNGFLTLEPGEQTLRSATVVSGQTLEVCLAQYWSSLGTSRVSMLVQFRGLEADDDELTLPADGSPTSIRLTSRIHRERLNPSASLTTHRQLRAADEARIEPLTSPRDRLVDGRPTGRLLLTYKFSQPTKGDTTIRVPRLDGLLYDSPLEGHQWMLFDKNQQLIATDDLFPEAFSLEKGEYTVRLALRSGDPALLDTLRGTVLAVDRRLNSPVTVQVSPNAAAAAAGAGPFPARWLEPGESATVWLAPKSPDSLPDGVAPGDLLLGEVHWVKSPNGHWGADSRPEGVPLTYLVPPAAPADKDVRAPEAPKPTLAERLAKDRLQLRIDQLAKLDWPEDRELFEQLQGDILRDHPDAAREILAARLQLVDDEDRKDRLPEVVAVADELLATIDSSALAARLALRTDPDDPKAQSRLQKDEQLKATLVDTLYRKGRALGYMELPEVVAEHPITDQQAHDRAFEATFRELAQWVDTTEKEYALLHIRRDRRHERWGQALQRLNTLIEQASPPEKLLEKKRRDLYEHLGWNDWREYAHKWMLIRFPEQTPAF